MTQYRPSIVEYFSKQQRNCGYCSSSSYGSLTYGLHAHTLRVEDYQNMIDRGWRRCGKYCYKPILDNSCCPLYTIRCAAKDFKLSKTQKKILKRFNNYLVNGSVAKEKIYKATEIVQPMDAEMFIEDKRNADTSNTIVLSVDASASALTKSVQNACAEGKITKPTEIQKKFDTDIKRPASKNKSMKAKYLRIERKKEKLQKLGLAEEEIKKKLIEKKKYPIVKTIEDFLNEPASKNTVHTLKTCLVRSCPKSEEFTKTFSAAFDLYKRYQMFIHKDAPEKLTPSQFEGFLVNSPLQIKLVLVNSPDFKNSFKESFQLFAKYQKVIHQESDKECDAVTFNDFLVNSPLEADRSYGSYHQQYWLDDKLIAVGVIDILPKCVSSVYFFYDPDFAYLSLGTYGALREVEFTRKLSNNLPDLEYYYMGFYIHSCVKMKYKGAFKPSYLLCPEKYSWHIIEECLPKLEVSKYSPFNEDPNACDVNSIILPSDVLILHNRTSMSLDYYLRKKKCSPEEYEKIIEYAKVIGKACARNMLLLRI